MLEGYSQGASAVVNALPKLTGTSFHAVKAVILHGNPNKKPNLACNVIAATRSATGLEAMMSQGVPQAWVYKTMDFCLSGDMICGGGFGMSHMSYMMDQNIQSQGANFAIRMLKGGSSNSEGSSSATGVGLTSLFGRRFHANKRRRAVVI